MEWVQLPWQVRRQNSWQVSYQALAMQPKEFTVPTAFEWACRRSADEAVHATAALVLSKAEALAFRAGSLTRLLQGTHLLAGLLSDLLSRPSAARL